MATMTPNSKLRRAAVCLGLLLLCAPSSPVHPASRAQAAPYPTEGIHQIHLPLMLRNVMCQASPAQDYVILSADPPGPTMAVEIHPDYNLAVRGYDPTVAYQGLIEYGGSYDPLAPQLAGLFERPRLPGFVGTYQVYDWDWEKMQRGPLMTHPPVSALGLETTAGELLHVPDSGYAIGSGCEVLVIYATTDRITLKYTREDNVISGYTLHIDHICVDPALLTAYHACEDAGRAFLPALRPHQPFGRASGAETIIAIVDTGTFLDARSHLDWWRDY